MTDTSEMIRLIRHAADRLDEEDPGPTYERLLREMVDDVARVRYMRELRSLSSATTQAAVVLRMVAACLTEEGQADGVRRRDDEGETR